MSTSQVQGESDFASLASKVGSATDAAKGLIFFDFSAIPWNALHMEPDGGGQFPQSVVDGIDLQVYFEGMELQALDFGSFNILNTRIPPGFKIPRHYHNVDQIVFVLEGSSVQGNKAMRRGEGYFTKAEQPYSITAGPEGLTWMEIRSESLTTLETIWLDTDPKRWVHVV